MLAQCAASISDISFSINALWVLKWYSIYLITNGIICFVLKFYHKILFKLLPTTPFIEWKKTSPWSGSSNHHHPYPVADSHLLGKEANCTPWPSGSTNEPSTNGWNTPIMAATKAAQFWFPRTSEGPVPSNYRPKTYISTAWKVCQRS